jgi:hypothetical protein
MKLIPLTKGLFAAVDDSDYDHLQEYKWFATKGRNKFYAGRCVWRNRRSITILMHREILRPKPNEQIDHADGNPLNNQKSNLRVATPAQNNANRGKTRSNTSGYKGVFWDKTRDRWYAQINVSRKHLFLGRYKSLDLAAAAYQDAALLHYGDFAQW